MMTYQEEEWSRLRRQSTKQAISLAMEGSWKEAIAVNQSILEAFPDDVEALNRLGRAYLELGEYQEAEAAYRRTTEIDPYNAIAVKNLQRLTHLKEVAVAGEIDADRLEPQYFIEEIGKAGIIQLVELAPPEVIARLVAGDRVQLRIDGTDLIVENSRGTYLGRVEAEHGQRLARLMAGGNRYSAAVVSLADGAVRVIIREVFRDPSQAGRLSFPSRGVRVTRPDYSERAIRRELEQEASREYGYTVVGGGDEMEILSEDSSDDDSEVSDEE
ncbi:MAG TPA: tetratricopeptide repeat protein [Dehalococcoidia bacterium]|nr:tetratricopeptide repeat protein [Dehalococcoidia bacterium]